MSERQDSKTSAGLCSKRWSRKSNELSAVLERITLLGTRIETSVITADVINVQGITCNARYTRTKYTRGNRKRDNFKCQKCSYEGDADVVAATNIFQRGQYSEITLYTPTKKVKKFFMQKHQNSNHTKENS